VRRVGPLMAWTSIGVAAGLLLGLADAAAAATYSVNPTRVFLTAQSRSALVTIKNESDQPLRFQLSMTAWSQDPAGGMVLAPSEDVLFFPALLTLEQGEERKIRVAAATSFADIEKTYRLFIEELPSADRPGQAGAVQVLTRTGIPIFLQPPSPKVTAALEGLAASACRLSFVFRNTGTAHVLPLALAVTGRDAEGQAVFERDAKIWYVLAGGTRAVDFDLPRPECERVRQIEVKAQLDGGTISERLATPRGACEAK